MIDYGLAAWLGSLVNGPIADRFGRKSSILMAVVVFIIGSAIQAGAVSIAMIFVGKRYCDTWRGRRNSFHYRESDCWILSGHAYNDRADVHERSIRAWHSRDTCGASTM